MSTGNIEQALNGIEEAKRGNTNLGLQLLKDAVAIHDLPEAKAWHGYCLARENNNFKLGISQCKEARQKRPRSSEIYLALGRTYLLAGLRASAIRTLQQGLKLDNNQEIYRLLASIGIRKPPVFRFLDRKNRFNVISGRLLQRIGLR